MGRVIVAVVLAAVLGVEAFGGAPVYPIPARMVNNTPTGSAVADFDGDGRLDAALSLFWRNELLVLLGDGRAGFGPAAYISAGDGPWGIAATDLNADGNVDLVVASEFVGELAVLLGRGDGTFDPEMRVPGAGYRFVATGDLDGDGVEDLASAIDEGSIRVHAGLGDGSFASPITLADVTAGPVAVADLNRDGRDDIVSGRAVRLSQGGGVFVDPGTLPCLYGCSDAPEHVALGDLDGDGVSDLVLAPYLFPELRVHRGLGDGTFAEGVIHSIDAAPLYVVIHDFDEDGRNDVLASLESETVAFLRSTAAGLPEPAPDFESTRSYGLSLGVGDFDGDRRLDLLKPAVNDDDLVVLLGGGDGSFQLNRNFPAGAFPFDVVAARFDGDALADLAVVNRNGGDVTILTGDGAGGFTLRGTHDVGTEPVSLIAADFDDDGALDLAVADYAIEGRVWVLRGTGDGGFAAAVPHGAHKLPTSIASGDLNADGHADLVVAREQTADVSILLGAGDGSFATAAPVPVGSAPVDVAVARIDGDAHLDVAVANSLSDDVTILLGNGDGTFHNGPTLATGSFPDGVAVGDVDGRDGLDLVVAEREGWSFAFFPGNGDGSFGARQIIDAEQFVWNVAIEDLDADGRNDIVGTSRGVVIVVPGNGDGTFRAPVFFSSNDSVDCDVEDFDGDGRLDLVTANGLDDDVSILLNLCNRRRLRFAAGKTTLSWDAVCGAADYNVYRGDLDALVDADADGLPDPGYGVCVSGGDLDPTDTELDDPEIPPEPGSGFFYLMTYVDGSGESDLGLTSAGLVRPNLQPCP